MEDKKGISSQHGYTILIQSVRLTNLIAFSDGTTGWMDKGRAVNVVYQDFSKGFDTIFHNILIAQEVCIGKVDGEVD